MKDRNIIILTKIIQYADEIKLTINTLEVDSEKFENDFISRNAISMCLLQIGELVGKLSDAIKIKYNKIPWRDVIALRNRAAHAYGELDTSILWEIANEDIPELKVYCEEIITRVFEGEKHDI